jgi:hypothetical protein
LLLRAVDMDKQRSSADEGPTERETPARRPRAGFNVLITNLIVFPIGKCRIRYRCLAHKIDTLVLPGPTTQSRLNEWSE